MELVGINTILYLFKFSVLPNGCIFWVESTLKIQLSQASYCSGIHQILIFTLFAVTKWKILSNSAIPSKVRGKYIFICFESKQFIVLLLPENIYLSSYISGWDFKLCMDMLCWSKPSLHTQIILVGIKEGKEYISRPCMELRLPWASQSQVEISLWREYSPFVGTALRGVLTMSCDSCWVCLRKC